MRKFKNPPRNVKKSLLVASFIGAVLRAHKTGTPKLTALHIRIDQSMKRFVIIAGSKAYNDVTNEGQKMWMSLAKQYSTKLTFEETEVFSEYIGYLLSDKDYKEFLGFTHFESSVTLSEEKLHDITTSLIALGEMIDEYCGTKPCTNQVRVIKAKSKVVRDVSSKLTRHQKEVIQAKSRKTKKKLNLASLRERAEKLRKAQ